MVEVARTRLARHVPAEHLWVGDVLQADAYCPEGNPQPHQSCYDVVFAYDLVQQLPRKLQWKALSRMLECVVADGVVMVFDNDCRSRFGRVAGLKKFITRHSGIELVPRWYCNAQYPPLASLARRVRRQGAFAVEVLVSPNRVKRVLIARQGHSAG